MENSLKYILSKRNCNQTEFAKGIALSKQHVSKMICRQRNIPEAVQLQISDFLKVPLTFFVDNERKCKLLTVEDIETLEEFFIKQELDVETDNPDEMIYLNHELMIRERRLSIHSQKRLIQKLVCDDLLTPTHGGSPSCEEEYQDAVEYNISFYKKWMELRRSNKISDIEWECVLAALRLLTMSEDDARSVRARHLTSKLYDVLIEERKLQEKARLEMIEFVKEQFGKDAFPNQEE